MTYHMSCVILNFGPLVGLRRPTSKGMGEGEGEGKGREGRETMGEEGRGGERKKGEG